MTTIEELSNDIKKQTQIFKREENKLLELQRKAREIGAYWLIKKEFNFTPLTCNMCWSGVNQEISRCEKCPSFNMRKTLTKEDIYKINEHFIFCSR